MGKIQFILMLLAFACTSAFADSIEKEFKRKYNLKKHDYCLNVPKDINKRLGPIKEENETPHEYCLRQNKDAEEFRIFKIKNNIKKDNDCFNIPKDIQKLLTPIDEKDATTHKLCLIKNDKAEELNLLFFNVTRIECHACGPELWFYKRDSRPSLFRISSNFGETGNPPAIADAFAIQERNFFIFKSNFLAQGVTESSLNVYEFNTQSNKLTKTFFSFLSGTNFEGQAPNCVGWDTKYTIDLEKKEIEFIKEGQDCVYVRDTDDGLGLYKNGKKISEKQIMNLK